MNWIKENKFVFGFLVVTVIGVAVGGWFLFGAMGRNDAAMEEYQRRVAELNRLQRLPIFPNKKNLDKIVGQQTEVNTEVSALASSLAAQQLPVEDVSPEQFQDKLKAAVTSIAAKAKGSSPVVKVPEPKFFLGFERYETAPPAKEAAGVLARELKAIEWVTNQLIDNKVVAITKLDRDPLPEEKGGTKAPPAPPAPLGKQAPGKPAEKGGVKYEVEKHNIQLVFVADQVRFRKFLNAVADYKSQYFIPRLVTIKNEKPLAPARVLAAPPVAAVADPAAAAAQPAPGTPAVPAAAPAAYILGEEKIEVTLLLEMVDFREVTPK